MTSAGTSKTIASAIVSIAGWSLLFCSFITLGLALVLFTMTLAEFAMFDRGFTSLTLTVFILSVVLLLCSLFLIHVGRVLRRSHLRPGLCPKCAYPVGTSDKCTECGAAVTPPPKAATA